MSHPHEFGVPTFDAPIGPTPSGAPLPANFLPGFGGGGGGDASIEAILAALAQLSGGGGGGFAPPAFSGTEAGLRLQSQLGLDQLRLGGQLDINAIRERAGLEERIGIRLEELRQKGALTLQERQEAFQLEQQRKQLEQERLIAIAQTKGQDPVRAVLLGLGIGGELVPGGERFKGLGPVAGAEKFRASTEEALQGLLGRSGITIGEQGVSDLGSVEQSARTFQQGTGAGRTLLKSAFGVGSEATGGGLATEDILRRIQDVTPQGVLQ